MSFGGGSEFEQLMQQAASIKTEQVNQDKRKYDSQPSFVRNSVFHCRDEKIVQGRKASKEERLKMAEEMKLEGNMFYKERAIYDAVDKYEHAIGYFWFAETSETNWREKGIRDEWITYHMFDESDKEVLDFICTCINNIALCKYKIKEWSECIAMCDQVLELDPKNAKALYRRAMALTTPTSSGGTEMDQAVRDLKRAQSLDPQDCAVKKELAKLLQSRAKQKIVDKDTFTGMFERGEIVNDKLGTTSLKQRNLESANGETVEFYQRVAKSFRQKGKDQEADEIEKAIEKSKENKRHSNRDIDFLNPTREMIADAKAHGVDLTDPVIRQALDQLTKEKSAAHSGDSGFSKTSTSSLTSTIFSPWVLLVSLVATLALYFGLRGIHRQIS